MKKLIEKITMIDNHRGSSFHNEESFLEKSSGTRKKFIKKIIRIMISNHGDGSFRYQHSTINEAMKRSCLDPYLNKIDTFLQDTPLDLRFLQKAWRKITDFQISRKIGVFHVN